MIFSRLNLRTALLRERKNQQQLLNEANDILIAATSYDTEIISRLKNGNSALQIEAPINKENIFTIDQIRKICIRYRLRFLDSKYFNSEYPYEAVSQIKAFEKKHGIKIQSFRILAPGKAFNLENINKDPLLFAQLSDNNYFLLHQWGNDLAWYRKILAWPLQNLKTLMISLFCMCMLFSLSIPSSVMNVFNFETLVYLRIWLAIHTFIGALGFVLWGGLSFNKNFSQQNWDSKYYNY